MNVEEMEQDLEIIAHIHRDKADRKWNGLTISDIDTIIHAGGVAEQSKSGMWHILPHAFAEKIEALLKEKNT